MTVAGTPILPQPSIAERFDAVAQKQHGLITLEQAREVGITDDQAGRLIEQGFWRRVSHGIYRTAGAPQTWEQRVWIACLETDGVASHLSAGYLWRLDGLPRWPPRRPEILLRHDNRRLSDFAKVRRSRSLCDEHIFKGDGLPRTNLARTVIDLADVLTPKAFSAAFYSALRQVEDLRPWIRRLLETMPRGRRHPGRAKLDELVADSSPALDSAFEVKIRQLMRDHGIPEASTGHSVTDDNGYEVKLDFAWPEHRPPVGLLAHGKRFHLEQYKWDNDIDQSSGLSVMRWIVLQCTYKQVTEKPALFIRRVRRALGIEPLPP